MQLVTGGQTLGDSVDLAITLSGLSRNTVRVVGDRKMRL